MNNIYVSVPVSKKEENYLKSIAPESTWVFGGEIPQGTNIVFGNVEQGEVAKLKKLNWLQTNSAGTEPYMQQGVLPTGCVLTNATGGYGLAISEHMLAMHLALIKNLPLYRDLQNRGEWKDCGSVTSVNGAVVLVLGLGDIGGDYAKLVKAMGAYVIGVRRTDLTLADYADEIHLTQNIDTLLPRADVVAIALPGTGATNKLIGKRQIELMKKGAIILNVGRGTVIDTKAMCNALESGKLGGAGLDVTDPEPLPADHKLWSMPTAIITPHVSGGFHLDETRQRIVSLFAENLKKFVNGHELNNIVDFETGYRRSKNS